MKTVKLTLEQDLAVPLEVEALNPLRLADMSIDEIKSCEIWYGKAKKQTGEIFKVEVTGGPPDLPADLNLPHEDICLELYGNLSRVKRIGQGMGGGLLIVHGDAGVHLGSLMTGGIIVVEGSSGDWTGAQMSGGQIRVQGDAGNFTGSAYWGNKSGMTGGMIIIGGSAADMTGRLMRRGLIIVMGDAGDFTAGNMIAGTVIVGGSAGRRTGAEMKRGTVLLTREPDMMPTFRKTSLYEPVFVNIFVKYLKERGVTVPGLHENITCRRFAGDQAVQGKGEIMICQSQN
ncbi:MAG: formylmethanofuran dehydrogenase subunit C [Firmicutes bacterium]|nr:formylmethanofuran dehydrogenase subunit C [Bacillota bacterium]